MTAPARIIDAADDPSVTPGPSIETLSVYHEIKLLLVAEGVPEHEIAFVHDYEGPAAQAELSRKLNAGEIMYSDNKVSNSRTAKFLITR
jgi:hypothetical protein